jgi:hypothetical protein
MLLLALLACDPAPTTPETAPEPEPVAEPATGGLSLNGDAKWGLDESTRARMIAIRGTLSDAQSAESPDPATVANAVSDDLNAMIAGCSMEGPAHDELHVFLMAFMPAVRAYSTSEGQDAVIQLQGLADQVAEFDRVFE